MSASLKIKKLSPSAILPILQSPDDIGFDLSSNAEVIIEPHRQGLVPTGLSMEIPTGMYGRIAPNAEFSLNFEADVGAGVIDEDYRGHVQVVVFNFSENPLTVHSGENVARFMLEKVTYADVI
eukprot:GHVL01025810.1.p1 GENE.GHVL01025810.1~~GHVL01025810.1.p1  ORF type:complete len:123 (+),score=19.79 GHVL01025810.1:31-399(+)